MLKEIKIYDLSLTLSTLSVERNIKHEVKLSAVLNTLNIAQNVMQCV